ncbi:hypothetical protein [Streptomyces sp. SID13031]|uniref:hypothetical protein n=1 Tax=Streptomyces sp. SID13031 TaxID=2706046 RepID=UPI0013C8A8F9|nr:hypothetical protein [Streptomyces sp. SID13031]NEA37545.1 hypothetical protein [Streptomyces sp. SID13031]
MNTELQNMAADVAMVERLIAFHPELADTAYQVHIQLGGDIVVEVQGSHYEAMLWGAAIDGPIYPSHVDMRGVRRQLVLGRGVRVQVSQDTNRRSSFGGATAA